MSLTERNLTVDQLVDNQLVDSQLINEQLVEEIDSVDVIVEDIETNVRDAFLTSPDHGLRELEVQLDGTTILISGQVTTFYQKQLAQEVVRHHHPELQIINSIIVD